MFVFIFLVLGWEFNDGILYNLYIVMYIKVVFKFFFVCVKCGNLVIKSSLLGNFIIFEKILIDNN